MSVPDNFCAAPWVQMMVHPGGEICMCSWIRARVIADDGTTALISRHRPLDVWNGKFFVETRKAFAEGRWPSYCLLCKKAEELSYRSCRTVHNGYTQGPMGLSVEALLKQSEAENHILSTPPRILFLNMGSLCNLACRMCSPLVSSKAAADPAMSLWRPVDTRHRWNGTAFSLGPEQIGGVETAGLELSSEESKTIWSDGKASFRTQWSGLEQLEAVEVDIVDPQPGWFGRPVEVTLNGRKIGKIRSNREATTLRFPTPAGAEPGAIEIGVRSSLRKGRGVGISDVRLIRPKRPKADDWGSGDFFGRIPGNRDWQYAPELIRPELFSDLTELRMVKLTGGEPMVQPRARELLDWLIESGAASHILLLIFTNGLIASDDMLDRLKYFRGVTAKISLDGVGDAYEYIRWPGKWEKLCASMEKWKAAANVRIEIFPTIMSYSLPKLMDLVNYCAGEDYDIALRRPLQDPSELGIAVLPPSVRQNVQIQLQAFLDAGCSEALQRGVRGVINQIQAVADDWDETLVRRFMNFTRDVDRQRGESFAKVFPEVVQAFADAGRPWPKD